MVAGCLCWRIVTAILLVVASAVAGGVMMVAALERTVMVTVAAEP